MNAIKLQLAVTALAAASALLAQAGAEAAARGSVAKAQVAAPAPDEPRRWPLLAAGLALAAWMARRRLSHPL